MTKTILAGGCSFTFGHELSDDDKGSRPSNKTWSAHLSNHVNGNYFCVAKAGTGNSAIARRVFNYVANTKEDCVVLVMWSFASRYDWAMPRHRLLENTRWAAISPWDTNAGNEEAFRKLANSEAQQEQWKIRQSEFEETKVKPFAEAIYRYAANQYHETYLSWKSIIWLQNILEKKKIPYMFTLADNSIFYDRENQLYQDDSLMKAMYNEINFANWFAFGERMMGFNQWALLEDYPRGTTHPLDEAHKDAYKLMTEKFEQTIDKEA